MGQQPHEALLSHALHNFRVSAIAKWFHTTTFQASNLGIQKLRTESPEIFGNLHRRVWHQRATNTPAVNTDLLNAG